MCIRDSFITLSLPQTFSGWKAHIYCEDVDDVMMAYHRIKTCLLYTSDAADERSSVDLGGRRIIKKKTDINT